MLHMMWKKEKERRYEERREEKREKNRNRKMIGNGNNHHLQ